MKAAGSRFYLCSSVGKRERLEIDFTLFNAFDPSESIGNFSGNLPHWRQDGTTYFVTFRMADSLPREKLRQWLDERATWLQRNPDPHSEAQRREYWERFPARFQYWLDQGHGACVLRQSKLRKWLKIHCDISMAIVTDWMNSS